jgi:hypothetical protein
MEGDFNWVQYVILVDEMGPIDLVGWDRRLAVPPNPHSSNQLGQSTNGIET